MGARTRTDPPSVVVATVGPADVLRQVLAGVEEEGVPHTLLDGADPALDAEALARRAAAVSSLGVGVGHAADGSLVVAQVDLPDGRAVRRDDPPVDPAAARRCGHAAARVVVRAPLP